MRVPRASNSRCLALREAAELKRLIRGQLDGIGVKPRLTAAKASDNLGTLTRFIRRREYPRRSLRRLLCWQGGCARRRRSTWSQPGTAWCMAGRPMTGRSSSMRKVVANIEAFYVRAGAAAPAQQSRANPRADGGSPGPAAGRQHRHRVPRDYSAVADRYAIPEQVLRRGRSALRIRRAIVRIRC